MQVSLILNGQTAELPAEPQDRLSTALRAAGLTGLKEGCLEGECGACTVLLDGQPVCSCLMLAAQAEGHQIETIEGLAQAGPSDLQAAFVREGAVQCGYCTPGMVMAAEGLLRANPTPSEAEIRQAIAGNICRCTGYVAIIRAIGTVAASRHAASHAVTGGAAC